MISASERDELKQDTDCRDLANHLLGQPAQQSSKSLTGFVLSTMTTLRPAWRSGRTAGSALAVMRMATTTISSCASGQFSLRKRTCGYCIILRRRIGLVNLCWGA